MKEITEELDKNLQIYSVEDWKEALSSNLAFKYTTKPYNLNPKILYRARLNQDTERKPIKSFSLTEQLWAPPSRCVSRIGRCNTKGQSTLYCATSIITTLFEIRPDSGDEITFIEYAVLGDIKTLGIVGAREIANLGQDYKSIFGGHFNETSKEAVLLDNILSQIFCTHNETKPIYNLTNAVYQTFLITPQEDLVPDFMKPPKFNGVIYPSVATDKLLGIDIALEPDSVKDLLKPVIAYKYKVLNKVDEHHYEIILTDITSEINVKGEMFWTPNKNAIVEQITDLPKK